MDASTRRAVLVGAAVMLAGIVLAVVVVRLSGSDSKQPASPPAVAVTNGTTAAGRTPLPGFGETHVTVKTPTSTLSWCLLLAATVAQQDRGLMQVTDPKLGGYDGMLFRFDHDTTVRFYMRNTPMPLSIAWIASDGHFVSSTDMPPCEDRDGCPTFGAAAPYRVAIEVPQGGLGRLGIGPGATVVDDNRGC